MTLLRMKKKIKGSLRQFMADIYYLSHHSLIHFKGKIIILMYHRVVSDRELDDYFIQPGMYVNHNVFEKQIKFLKKNFTILSFEEFLQHKKGNRLNPKDRYCIITFDDGWLDNYIYAYPILKDHQVYATIFLPTDFIGTKRWFWPDQISFILKQYYDTSIPKERKDRMMSVLSRYINRKDLLTAEKIHILGDEEKEEIDLVVEKFKDLPEKDTYEIISEMSEVLGVKIPNSKAVVDWAMIHEMSLNGISFGSHSCSHSILTKLKAHEVKKELHESMRVLKGKKINYVNVFAYPNGNNNDEIQKLINESGYAAAVTTTFGAEGIYLKNLYGLKRINIHNDITTNLPLFNFHISGLQYVLKKSLRKGE